MQRALRAVYTVVFLPALAPAQLTFTERGVAPAGRSAHAAFYDEPRGRVTIVGGRGAGSSYLDEVWGTDSNSWVRYPQAGLPALTYPVTCDDPTGAGRIVLHGGIAASGIPSIQTYRWDPTNGAAFVGLAPGPRPLPRYSTAMALDPGIGAILYGGLWVFTWLSDTYVWNGNNWVQLAPTSSPPGLYGHAMAFDPVNHRVMLFGGSAQTGLSGATWAFSGNAWTNVSPATSPSPRRSHAMALDPLRRRIVVFGGFGASLLGDTWEWDGTDWQQVFPRFAPPARGDATLTWDGIRQRLVLFGGAVAGGTLGDSWSWDGTNWTRITYSDGSALAAGPSARHSGVMAYDRVRKKTLLFGGRTSPSNVANGETWESDSGRTWAQRAPVVSPPPRFLAASAALRSTGQTFVLGGWDDQGVVANDLYRWDSSTWIQLRLGGNTFPTQAGAVMGSLELTSTRGQVLVHFGGIANTVASADTHMIEPATGTATLLSVPGPSARAWATLAHSEDPLVEPSTVYMFGGQAGASRTNELWSLQESGGTFQWTLLVPLRGTPVPAGRQQASLAYHSASRRIYMFGGGDQSVGFHGDTWYWETDRWTQVNTSAAPSPRTGASMVYDAQLQRIILTGGADATTTFDDVWEFDGSTWRRLAAPGKPSPRASHSLVYDAGSRRCVLFGGQDEASVALNDTWNHDGTRWAPQVSAGVGPSPRHGHTACFDERTRQMIVFGGRNDTTQFGETWHFDGSAWHAGGAGPAARYDATMAYDSNARRCVLVGGVTGARTVNDTWVYDAAAATWTRSTTMPGVAQTVRGMAYDKMRGRIVVVRRVVTPHTLLDESLEFDTATGLWSTPRPGPAFQDQRNEMAYDTARGRLMFMAPGGNGASDLFQYDTLRYQQQSLDGWVGRLPETTVPSARRQGALTYDSDRGRLVIFGGESAAGVQGDLWELFAPVDGAGSSVQSTVHAPGPPLRCHSQPILGQTFKLWFAAPLGGLLFLDVGPVQQPAFELGAPWFCSTTNFFTTGLVVIPVASPATPNLLLPVPNDPSLRGSTLLFQGVAIKPAGCLEATDPLHARF